MKALSVLIVDDDRDFGQSLAIFLRLEGYEVESVFDGEAAVEKFRARDFDAAFLDVKLPGMNGVESFLEIRKLKPGARVFIMTGFSVEELLRKAVDNGAVGVFHKPLDLGEVLKALKAAAPSGIVLVADDDPDFVRAMEMALTENGYSVCHAHTGREAVDRMFEGVVDYLVLDLRLPVLSGLEVYLELKKQGLAVPTVIVTGYAVEEAESINVLRAMNVTGCLVKPFDPAELAQALEEMSNGRDTR
jgi:DNA-binding response OmpR family regulator